MTHLITSLGNSPEVLTEALWLLERDRGISISHLTCVGTSTSLDQAKARVFEVGGALDRLRTHLGKPSEWLAPDAISWAAGALEAVDNRNAAEAAAMDRTFRQAILGAQEGNPGPVIACISGGRKTMSSSLQQAMCLLARPQDWAFHVLLRCPDEATERVLQRSGWGFPGDGFPRINDLNERATLQAESGQFGLDAIEAPIVRLREVAALNGLDFGDEALVHNLQRAFEIPKLQLNLFKGALDLVEPNQTRRLMKLPPQQALLFAAMVLAGRPTLPPDLASWGEEIGRKWEAHPAAPNMDANDCRVFFSPEANGEVVAIQAPASRLRNKLEKALRRIDPRLAKFFTFHKGTRRAPHIGFGEDACRHIQLTGLSFRK